MLLDLRSLWEVAVAPLAKPGVLVGIGRPAPPRPRQYRATAEIALTLEMVTFVVFRPRPRVPEPGEDLPLPVFHRAPAPATRRWIASAVITISLEAHAIATYHSQWPAVQAEQAALLFTLELL